MLDKHKCRKWGCGIENGVEVHHIIPRSQGGPDKEWNLITLCSFHHAQVTSKKLKDLDLLKDIRKKRDFRWSKSMEWHQTREELRGINDPKPK